MNGRVQQNIICIFIWSVLAIIWKFLSPKWLGIITLQVFTFKHLTFQCFNVKSCKCHYQCIWGPLSSDEEPSLLYSLNSDHHYSVYKDCKRQHTLAFASHQHWDFWLFYWLLKSLRKCYKKNQLFLKGQEKPLSRRSNDLYVTIQSVFFIRKKKNEAFLRPADPKHFKKSLCSTKHLCPVAIFQMQK